MKLISKRAQSEIDCVELLPLFLMNVCVFQLELLIIIICCTRVVIAVIFSLSPLKWGQFICVALAKIFEIQ